MSDSGWDDKLSALYFAEATQLVSLAAWIVGSPSLAEELVHDTFARLLEKPAVLDDPDRLLAYVRAAVVNRSRSRIRRLALERRHAKSQPRTAAISDADPEIDSDVRTAIASLPRRQREVVVLRFHADLDIAGIAGVLGISSGSVKTHLHRALKTLETQLDEPLPTDRSPAAVELAFKDTTT